MQRNVIAAMLLFCWPFCVQGAVTLDQYQQVWSGARSAGTGTAYMKAQTFTAGLSGVLDHIDISLDQSEGAVVNMQVRNVAANGSPSNTVLGNAQSANSIAQGWNSFTFGSQSIPMTAGKQYAIVMWKEGRPSQYYGLDWNHDSESYLGGQAWGLDSGVWEPLLWDEDSRHPADFMFSTYVNAPMSTDTTTTTVPVPGAILLASVGCGALGCLRKRKMI